MVNNKFAANFVYWSCTWQSVQSMILVVVTRQEIAKLQLNYTGVNSNNIKKCCVGPNYNLSQITYPTTDLPVAIWVIVINVTSNQALTFLFVAVAIAFLVTFTIYLHAAWIRLKFGKINPYQEQSCRKENQTNNHWPKIDRFFDRGLLGTYTLMSQPINTNH